MLSGVTGEGAESGYPEPTEAAGSHFLLGRPFIPSWSCLIFTWISDPPFGPATDGPISGNGVLDRGYARAKLPPSRVESLMASERVQRQIDRLLDEAEKAISRYDALLHHNYPLRSVGMIYTAVRSPV